MKVTGDNVVLYEYVSGDWVPYACAQNISINFTTDFIETSVSGSGNWATFLPTKNSWTANIDGIVSLEEAGKLSLADLHTKQFAQTQIQLKFERTDEAGNIYGNIGYAYISDSSDTGSFNGMDTFSSGFRGVGELVQVYDPTIKVGTYRASTFAYPIVCAVVLNQTLYSSDDFGTGTIMYVDAGLSIPLTGKTYIMKVGDGEIYPINSSTGEVGISTGTFC